MNIKLELTPQEAQWALGFIDAGLKAQGILVLDQAAALKAKLEAGAKVAAGEVPAAT